MSSYFGHWQKTWDVHSTRFEGANLGCAFSGWSDADSALRESTKVYSNLKGQKIITVGGGNHKGDGPHPSSNLSSMVFELADFEVIPGLLSTSKKENRAKI